MMRAMDSERAAGRLIVEIRRRRHLSQAELARAAGMTRSVVNAYEHARRQPSVEALARLAAAGGMQLRLGPREPSGIDPERAGRILGQVLDLAEALPHRRPGRLAYPPLLAGKR
jgi:transcriptional regulator with XRE-family HTH domain